jgi:predicted unusual protein kinase regulating ubiquinone biosynthesis (AarF/ABC1/UbiB family)
MVFYATVNNISVISWRSILLVEEAGENHRPEANHCQLSYNVVLSTSRHQRVRIHNFGGDRH